MCVRIQPYTVERRCSASFKQNKYEVIGNECSIGTLSLTPIPFCYHQASSDEYPTSYVLISYDGRASGDKRHGYTVRGCSVGHFLSVFYNGHAEGFHGNSIKQGQTLVSISY